MAEWLKAPDSKSGRGVDLLVGSNPTLSANWKIGLFALIPASQFWF